MFTTPEGLFEPTMIFFGLINLLVMFQTMINKILWDLINTREVASFFNKIIIETKEEKKHDEVVKEVVRRLAEYKAREVQVEG